MMRWEPGAVAVVFALAAALRWTISLVPRRVQGTAATWSLGSLLLAMALTDALSLRLPGLSTTPLATVGTALVALGMLLALWVSSAERGLGARVLRDDAEVLLLLAASGMTVLVGVVDVWTAFVAFEVMSLPFYALVAFSRSRTGVEAGVRLLLAGAAATALFALGAALGPASVGTAPADALARLGFVAVLAAALFKAALLPLGFWVGDVYRGAPVGVVAALAAAPKWAALIFVARWLEPAMALAGVRDVVAAVAQASLLLGSGLAMQRRTLRGIFAWSGVAHMGFALLLLLGPGDAWPGGLLVYGCGYVLAVTAAMAAVAAIEDRHGASDLAAIAGIGRNGDWLPAALIVVLFSMAGLPFLLGFWGKFLAMLAAARAAAWGSLAAALCATVLGLYVYLRVVGALAWTAPAAAASPASPTWRRMRWATVLAAVAVVVLGLIPACLAAPWRLP